MSVAAVHNLQESTPSSLTPPTPQGSAPGLRKDPGPAECAGAALRPQAAAAPVGMEESPGPAEKLTVILYVGGFLMLGLLLLCELGKVFYR